MKQPTEAGTNRTGIDMAPDMSRDMADLARHSHPTAGNGHAIERIRHQYDMDSPAIGAIPSPRSVKGKGKAGLKKAMGKNPAVFMNKLGERLAFERSGTRIYESILMKFEDADTWEGGPTAQELQRHHDQEYAHFVMLHDAIEKLGADPTAVTPGADVTAVASEGLLKVIQDPRTSFPESLEALLTIELTDYDGWDMLIKMADGLGQSALAERFQSALSDEKEHLSDVRTWLMAHAEHELRG